MRPYILASVLFVLLCSAIPAFAVDTAITVPTMGIDWSATVTSLIGTIGAIVVACLGLWAGLKLVQAAKRFVGGAVTGR